MCGYVFIEPFCAGEGVGEEDFCETVCELVGYCCSFAVGECYGEACELP